MKSPKTSFSIIAATLVVVFGLALVWLTDWNPFLIWISAVSLVTFILYGYDKTQAKIGGYTCAGDRPAWVGSWQGVFWAGGWVAGFFIIKPKSQYSRQS